MVLFLVNHGTEEHGVNLVSEVFLVLYGVARYRYRNDSRKREKSEKNHDCGFVFFVYRV